MITLKKAERLCAVVKRMPIETMLIETDTPFLAPVPFRGKTNEPAYVYYVAKEVAAIKGLSLEDVVRVTSLNGRRLFRIDDIP